MVKVISLSDRAYKLLYVRKRGRSFSKLVEDMVEGNETKGDIREIRKYFGILSKETADRIEKRVIEDRGRSKAVDVWSKW
jgi:predicted CopG family antitoxin